MSVELVAVGLNGVTAALAAGCVILVKLTVQNFRGAKGHGADEPSSVDSLNSPSEKIRLSLHRQELPLDSANEVVGNSSLLRRLHLPMELAPAVLFENARLSRSAANIGFSNLEVVLRELIRVHHDESPFLFGVNRGGGLLANLMSQRLNLDQKYLVRCDYRPDWKKVLCEHRPAVNFAIIIDDVVRSGETVQSVRGDITAKYPGVKVYVFALVVSVEENLDGLALQKKLFSVVDYYPWISRSLKTTLPWSHEDSNDALDYIEEDGVNQLVARVISHKGQEAGARDAEESRNAIATEVGN